MKMRSSFFPQPVFEAGGGGGDPPTGPWYEGKGLDGEAVGYFQARGWDKDAVTAAIEAGKSHREATKKLGVPEDQLARIPKKDDAAGWEQFHQKVNGKPADMKDYDFSGVKRRDGSVIPDMLAGVMRTMAHKLNLPKDAAATMAKDFLTATETADAAAIAEREQKIAEEHDKLADSWKAGFETNMLLARRTATTLGISDANIKALEKVEGYANVMNMLRNLGTIIGEDKYLKPGGGGGPERMTREMALSRISDLNADRDWVKKYQGGDTAAKREYEDLHIVAYGR